jgi:hypothetical protein
MMAEDDDDDLTLKEAILEAAQIVGVDGTKVRKGKGGLVGFCIRLACDRPAIFGSLLNRVLPQPDKGPPAKPVNRIFKSDEEARQALLDRGVPSWAINYMAKIGKPITTAEEVNAAFHEAPQNVEARRRLLADQIVPTDQGDLLAVLPPASEEIN